MLKQLILPSLPTAWLLRTRKRKPWASEIFLRLLLLSLKTVSRASFLWSHVRGELSVIPAAALINLSSPRGVEKGSQAEDIPPSPAEAEKFTKTRPSPSKNNSNRGEVKLHHNNFPPAFSSTKSEPVPLKSIGILLWTKLEEKRWEEGKRTIKKPVFLSYSSHR